MKKKSEVSVSGAGHETFTFVELFAGVGGFRCALERLGGRCVWACEIEHQARRLYRENFPEAPSPGGFTLDVCDANDELIPDHDLLVGGFPCQVGVLGVCRECLFGRLLAAPP